MSRMTPEQKRFDREHFGCPVAELRSEADFEAHNDAIFFFGRDGDRAKLMRELFAIGANRECIQWGLANPGCGCTCGPD